MITSILDRDSDICALTWESSVFRPRGFAGDFGGGCTGWR